MPIYQYLCEKCGNKVEIRQGFVGGIPLCCGKAMKKLPSLPAIIKIKGQGGVRQYPKGYKRDYSKEYLTSIGKEHKIPKT